MSVRSRRREEARWGEPEECLLDALTEALGPPSGSRGRSTKAYRQACRRMTEHGVTPERLPDVLQGYAIETLKVLGPMPLAAMLNGRLKVTDSRRLIVVRWANECIECEREVKRGEMAWWRKPEGAERGFVTCADCEPLDFGWERAAEARRWAVAKDTDPDSLLEAILAQTPALHREDVADDLAPHVAVREEA